MEFTRFGRDSVISRKRGPGGQADAIEPAALGGRLFGICRTSVSAGALLALGACTMVGPDFVTPEAPQSEAWLEEGDDRVKREETDISKWWEVFNDPILSELINKAAAQNLDLQTAGLRIIESRASLGIAIGNQFPQSQDIGAAYSRTKIANNAPNVIDADRNYDTGTVGFDAAWELDFWGKFRRGIESADASLAADIALYDDLVVSLTAEVASTYVLIREFQERIRLAEENVVVQTSSLNIADVRFKAGAVSELDVTQALALLRDTQATIPALQAQLRQAQNALAVLLGTPPYDLMKDLGGVKPIPTTPSEVALGIPADLLRRRPDIRRAEYEAAAQSARIGVARAELFPSISIGGFIGLQTSGAGGRQSGNAKLTDLFQADSLTGFISPQLRWPIFNYGRLTNNVRVQDARFQQFVVDYQNTVLKAYQETEDSLAAFLRTQERAKFLVESVKASTRSVDLALVQYREGIVDYQRVLDTQRDLVGRQDSLATTQGTITRSLVAVYKALGGGWEARVGKDIVSEETLKEMQARTDWGDLVPPEELPKEPPPKTEGFMNVRAPQW